jgi:hypothetical protein
LGNGKAKPTKQHAEQKKDKGEYQDIKQTPQDPTAFKPVAVKSHDCKNKEHKDGGTVLLIALLARDIICSVDGKVEGRGD